MSVSDLKDRHKAYEAAEKKWGRPSQLLLTIEECGELITEVAKTMNGRKEGNFDELAKELADVTVMVEQLTHMYGIKDLVIAKREEIILSLWEKMK